MTNSYLFNPINVGLYKFDDSFQRDETSKKLLFSTMQSWLALLIKNILRINTYVNREYVAYIWHFNEHPITLVLSILTSNKHCYQRSHSLPSIQFCRPWAYFNRVQLERLSTKIIRFNDFSFLFSPLGSKFIFVLRKKGQHFYFLNWPFFRVLILLPFQNFLRHNVIMKNPHPTLWCTLHAKSINRNVESNSFLIRKGNQVCKSSVNIGNSPRVFFSA